MKLRMFLPVCAAIFAAAFIWWAAPFKARVQKPMSIEEQDRAILSRVDATEYEVLGSLSRLGKSKDPLALTEALKRVKSSSVVVRSGAAFALGNFPDSQSLPALRELLADGEEIVRLKAIEGLGNVPSQDRRVALEELLARDRISPAERLEVYQSLIRSSQSSLDQAKWTDRYLESALSSRSEIPSAALLQALSIAPTDKRVFSFLRKVVFKAREGDESVPVAIRHLAVYDTEWMKKNFAQVMKSRGEQARKAVIETLHVVCPPGVWTVLADLTGDAPSNVLLESAAQEARLIGGSGSESFLNRLLVSGKLDEQGRSAVLGALKQVRESPSEGGCSAGS